MKPLNKKKVSYQNNLCMTRIAIVFPVFNGLSYTKKCLASLYDHIGKTNPMEVKFDIVITDDGSKDGTAEWITANFPEVHIRQGDGGLWWSGGINMAIRYALDILKSDYTLWWNNDVKAADDFFPNLVSLLDKQKEPSVFGSKVKLAQDPGIIWSMGGIFDEKTGYKTMIGSSEPDDEKYKQPVECDWLTGMGTVVHRSVYEKIGMVDEKNFPQYHGDSDFTLRARKAGFKIRVYPELVIFNDTTQTGLKHDESFRRLYQSLVSIKSNYNIRKDFLFYKRHTVTPMAYKELFKRYGAYIGGFFKWKILGLIGKKRT